MSQGLDISDTIVDGEIYPLSLASIFPNEDLAYLDRRLQEDAGRLFRDDRLRLELQTFPKGESGTIPAAEATAQRGNHPRRDNDNIITDEANFRIEFQVQPMDLRFRNGNYVMHF